MDIQVTIKLPDNFERIDSDRVSRDVFEQVVAESYRTGHIGLKQVRELLGLETRFEADAFIHKHGATGYDVKDLQAELEAMKDLGI